MQTPVGVILAGPQTSNKAAPGQQAYTGQPAPTRCGFYKYPTHFDSVRLEARPAQASYTQTKSVRRTAAIACIAKS